MEQYPSIPPAAKGPLGLPCFVFPKYDGSNLRFLHQPKKGWCRFGTRNRLFDETDELFGQALPLLQSFSADLLSKMGKTAKEKRITVFAEFFGPSSFAGSHDIADSKELCVFDIHVERLGFMAPQDFVKLFDGCTYASQPLYQGNWNRAIIEKVAEGLLGTTEGVVAKGWHEKKIWRSKVKNKKWIEAVWEKHGEKAISLI